MSAPESVESRRRSILALAGDQMDRARTRRVRRARIATAAALVAVAAAVSALLPRTATQPTDQRTLAIDFRSVSTITASVDFAVVRDTGVPLLDTLTDDEAEDALADAGYCVKIFRVRDQPMLVDCSTGSPAILGAAVSTVR